MRRTFIIGVGSNSKKIGYFVQETDRSQYDVMNGILNMDDNVLITVPSPVTLKAVVDASPNSLLISNYSGNLIEYINDIKDLYPDSLILIAYNDRLYDEYVSTVKISNPLLDLVKEYIRVNNLTEQAVNRYTTDYIDANGIVVNKEGDNDEEFGYYYVAHSG